MGKKPCRFFSISEAPSVGRTDKQIIYDTKWDYLGYKMGLFKQLWYQYGPFWVYKIWWTFHVGNVCGFLPGPLRRTGKGTAVKRSIFFPMQVNSMHSFMIVSYDLSVVIVTLQFCAGLLPKICSRWNFRRFLACLCHPEWSVQLIDFSLVNCSITQRCFRVVVFARKWIDAETCFVA